MSRYEKLLQRLRAGAQVMIDGGTGTEVERRGVPQLENAWNGGGALSHPDIVRDIHADYIRHGAEIVISNTFATSRHLLEDAGVPELFADYNRRGVELAREARAALEQPDVLVAGGISHWSFSGRLPSLDALRDGAAEQAAIMRNAGADLVMLEMMIDIARMLAVLEGAKTSGLPVWVGVSCAPDANGVMCLQSAEADDNGVMQAGDGETLRDAIEALAGQDVALLSIMHTDVAHIDACLDVVEAHWHGLVGIYAHSGEFIDDKWIFEGTITPADFALASQRWLQRKVQIIGGCCGIRPDHIAALSPQVYGEAC
ncbi:MAG: homocysteine S-methyltransferase family protein [Gammaproteobacteria bacterium]|nr:homocysteine S-methyltransferase family protein [Gammaproteobacteria bacterium]